MGSFYCVYFRRQKTRQLGDSSLLGSYTMSTIRVTGVSKDRIVFNFTVKKSQEDLNLQQNRCENIKFRRRR